MHVAKILLRCLGFIYDGILSSADRNANFRRHAVSHGRRKLALIVLHRILQGVTVLWFDQFCTRRTSYTRSGATSLVLTRARRNLRQPFFTIRAVPVCI